MLDSLIPFIGRFHPVIVHLPIGFVVAACLLEFLKGGEKRRAWAPAQRLLLGTGALFAATAIGTGLALAEEGGYNADLLSQHKWLTIGMSAALILAWLSKLAAKERDNGFFVVGYRVLLLASFVLMSIGAHQGGSMTHGGDYLTEHFPFGEKPAKPVREKAASPAPALVDPKTGERLVSFAADVVPILEEKCYSCHGEEKMKGDLRVDTPDFIRAGGSSGYVVAPGDADDSTLYLFTAYDEDDPDFMPQKGEGLTPEEIETLRLWIAQGAIYGEDSL